MACGEKLETIGATRNEDRKEKIERVLNINKTSTYCEAQEDGKLVKIFTFDEKYY